jgi:DNA-binding MarR family transcriptional regulator
MHMHQSHMHVLRMHKMRALAIIATAMTPKKNDQALLAAWHELAGRHARVASALERSLHTEHDLGITEFEVLERLATSAGNECRMQELGGATHLSQSALSRLVGRLEADGLVTRAMCPNDRRGIYAHITDEGRARYEAARATHRSVLAETL